MQSFEGASEEEEMPNYPDKAIAPLQIVPDLVRHKSKIGNVIFWTHNYCLHDLDDNHHLSPVITTTFT